MIRFICQDALARSIKKQTSILIVKGRLVKCECSKLKYGYNCPAMRRFRQEPSWDVFTVIWYTPPVVLYYRSCCQVSL